MGINFRLNFKIVYGKNKDAQILPSKQKMICDVTAYEIVAQYAVSPSIAERKCQKNDYCKTVMFNIALNLKTRHSRGKFVLTKFKVKASHI